MFIFDLDQTLIDSSHRTAKAIKNGVFCIDTYKNQCNTPELIARDQLLPLSRYAQKLLSKGEQFAIITARFLTDADHSFLIEHELINHTTIILGRESVTQDVRALGDVTYKLHQFDRLQRITGASSGYVMFDDLPNIVTAFNNTSGKCVALNAIDLNHALQIRSDMLATTSKRSFFSKIYNKQESKIFAQILAC